MKSSVLSVAAVLAASSCSASPAPRNQLHAVDTSHLPIRRDPTRPQPVLQQKRTGGGETVIVVEGPGGAAQGAAKPTVTHLQTVTTQKTVAAPAGTGAPPAQVVPPPAMGTGGMGGMLPPGMGGGAAQASGTGGGALPIQQPAPTQSLLPVTAGAGPQGFVGGGGGEVAVVAGLVSVVWGGLWILI